MTEKLPVRTIALHPKKKVALLAGAILSIFTAILFFHIFISLDGMPGKVLTIIMFIASIGALFFNILAFAILKKENFIGFFISSEGFNDISTGNNYGIVYWKDIIKIRIVKDLEHPKLKYIVLKVKDPQLFIDREPSIIKKRTLILKYHYYGSSICFSNRGLNCSFEELESCVRLYYDNFKQREHEKSESLKTL